MKKIKLYKKDYVLYDKVNDIITSFNCGTPVIYNIKQEASKDRRGNEIVISCLDLPKHHQVRLITWLNNLRTI